MFLKPCLLLPAACLASQIAQERYGKVGLAAPHCRGGGGGLVLR